MALGVPADGVALGVAAGGVGPPAPLSPVSPPESVGDGVGLSEPVVMGVGVVCVAVGVGDVAVAVGVGVDEVAVAVGVGDVALADGVADMLGEGVGLAAAGGVAVHDGDGVGEAGADICRPAAAFGETGVAAPPAFAVFETSRSDQSEARAGGQFTVAAGLADAPPPDAVAPTGSGAAP